MENKRYIGNIRSWLHIHRSATPNDVKELNWFGAQLWKKLPKRRLKRGK